MSPEGIFWFIIMQTDRLLQHRSGCLSPDRYIKQATNDLLNMTATTNYKENYAKN